jgi:hypothetical protein
MQFSSATPGSEYFLQHIALDLMKSRWLQYSQLQYSVHINTPFFISRIL